MKKIHMLLALCAVAMGSCGEGKTGGESEKAIVVSDSSALSQTLAFDATAGSAVKFTASGPWTSEVSQTPSDDGKVIWIEIAPDHGDEAGEYEMKINLLPNDTGADRTAEIDIFCGSDRITVSVTQRKEGAPSEGKITLYDGTKLTQTVSADSTHGESPVEFTTDGAWSATVIERSPDVFAAGVAVDGESWISVSPDHGDAAGDYEMKINLLPNDTGADRTAVITIRCGEAKVEAQITQRGVQGGVNPACRQLKSVTKFYTEGGSGHEYKASMEFKYDDTDRLSGIHSWGTNLSTGEREGEDIISVSHGEGTVTIRTESEWEGEYGDIDPAPAVAVGGRMTVEIIASLNADGYMETAELVTVYYNSGADGTEQEWDRERIEYMAHYSEGFLSAASWNIYNADGALTDSNDSVCRWSEGNMTEVERRYTHYDLQGGRSYTDETIGAAEYDSMPDNARVNLDLNWIIMDNAAFTEIDNSGVMAIMGLYGKKSANRLLRTCGKEPGSIEKEMRYSYKFDADGYVTEITSTEEGINITETYQVSYY